MLICLDLALSLNIRKEVSETRECLVRLYLIEKKKMKALERENRELRQANEILRKASAYFAMAELDRPFKR